MKGESIAAANNTADEVKCVRTNQSFLMRLPVFCPGWDSRHSPSVHSRTALERAIYLNKNTIVCLWCSSYRRTGLSWGRWHMWMEQPSPLFEEWGGQLNKRTRKEEKKGARQIKKEWDRKEQRERLGVGRKENWMLGDNIEKSHAFVISQFLIFLMNMDDSPSMTVPWLRLNKHFISQYSLDWTQLIFSPPCCANCSFIRP